jgi:hypothetical protein
MGNIMSRKLLMLAGVGLSLFVLLFIARFLLINRSPKEGVLKVAANVTSRVFLDNKDIGKTPLEQKIRAGEYSLRIVPEGTETSLSSWQGNIKIGPSVLTYVNRDLSESELTSSGEILWLEKIGSSKGELTVVSIPDGARVFVNDELKGIAPLTLTDLSENDYTLLVSSPGFEQRTIKIRITPGYKLTASLALALSPGQMLIDSEDEALSTPSAALSISPTPTVSAKITPSPGARPRPTSSPTPSPSLRPRPTSSPTPLASSGQKTAKKVEVIDTPTGFLRVREEASAVSAEIGRVKPKDQFLVLESKLVGGVTWYKIAYTETQDGWISGEYAKNIE